MLQNRQKDSTGSQLAQFASCLILLSSAWQEEEQHPFMSTSSTIQISLARREKRFTSSIITIRKVWRGTGDSFLTPCKNTMRNVFRRRILLREKPVPTTFFTLTLLKD